MKKKNIAKVVPKGSGGDDMFKVENTSMENELAGIDTKTISF